MDRKNQARTDRLFETRHGLLALVFIVGALFVFFPLRSTKAAETKVASPSLGTPAPHPRPQAPIGAGVNAAGEATLAASRRG